jgi:CRISPR-associated endoribonuclease Cas6
MLQKIIVQCKINGDQEASYNWGSLFHGVLLELLPEDVGEILHQSQLRPFSQFVLPTQKGHLSWNIGLWDDTLAPIIKKEVLALSQIELKHKGLTLDILDIKEESQSKEEYFTRFFTTSAPCRRYEIEFLTPCTHKQNGTYTLFPTPELIIQSLYRRYGAFAQDISIQDPEAMWQISQGLQIVRYSLRSAIYYLENTRIIGYKGKITLIIRGPVELARLAGALLFFAEYAGLGVKTALGMGGVRITAKG